MYCQTITIGESLGDAKKIVTDKLETSDNLISSLLPDLYKLKDSDINNFLSVMASQVENTEISRPELMTNNTKKMIERQMIQYRYSLNNGRLFEISNELSKALIKTDLTGKCPAKYFRLPFEHIYIYTLGLITNTLCKKILIIDTLKGLTSQ